MMKVFRNAIVLLLLILAGVLGAQWLARDGAARDLGEVLVRAGGYEYYASLPGALLALAACALLRKAHVPNVLT